MRPYLVLAIGVTVGCSNNQPPEREPTRVLPSGVEPAPKPDPAPIAKVDLSVGNGFEMRRPIHDGRLTLIPIIATRGLPARKFITLHDGMARDLVTVREISEDWDVSTVRITNKSSDPLVVLGGELIVDAMQDRVTAENTVIMAGKSALVNVRCVEEDRDHGGGTFHAGNALAELSLRRTVMHDSQDAVWQQVKVINRRHHLAPSTNTYRHAAHLQAKGASADRRDRIVAQLEALEERQQIVGLAVAVDGQVIAIDRMATPELYRQLETELLASYLPDTAGDQPEGRRLSPDDVRSLARLDRLAVTTDATYSVLRPL